MITVAGIDMAAWDALARAAGVPLCVLLGGSVGPVPAYNSNGLWLSSPAEVASEAARRSASPASPSTKGTSRETESCPVVSVPVLSKTTWVSFPATSRSLSACCRQRKQDQERRRERAHRPGHRRPPLLGRSPPPARPGRSRDRGRARVGRSQRRRRRVPRVGRRRAGRGWAGRPGTPFWKLRLRFWSATGPPGSTPPASPSAPGSASVRSTNTSQTSRRSCWPPAWCWRRTAMRSWPAISGTVRPGATGEGTPPAARIECVAST